MKLHRFSYHPVHRILMTFFLSFPFSGFFTSVKSELRNRSSEYSDISDSEDSGPDCTALVCPKACDLCLFDVKMNPTFLYLGEK